MPTTKLTTEDFKEKVFDMVREIHTKRFPYNNYLYSEYDEDGNKIQ